MDFTLNAQKIMTLKEFGETLSQRHFLTFIPSHIIPLWQQGCGSNVNNLAPCSMNYPNQYEIQGQR